MGAPADEQITKYMECLKSELGELETCLQNRTTAKQLCIASKRVVLAAAELDEMITWMSRISTKWRTNAKNSLTG